MLLSRCMPGAPDEAPWPSTGFCLVLLWAVLTAALRVQGTGLVGVGLSLLFFLQEKLIYVPRIPGVSNDIVYTPKDFGFSYEVPPQLRPQDRVSL